MRNKVYMDLMISPYWYKIGDLTYYFSTELHRVRFEERYITARLEMKERLKKRYGLNMACELASDIYTYMMMENRGFLIRTKRGEIIRWPEQIKLDGETLIVEKLPI